MPGPYSILAGGTATFTRSDIPPGSGGQATDTAPVYTSSDSSVVVGSDPSDPGNTDKGSLSVPAGNTNPSFDLNVTITPATDISGTPGTPVTNTFTWTIVQVQPPFVPTTGSDLTQTSGMPGKVARRRH